MDSLINYVKSGEYGFSKPFSLVVLIPFLSSAVQKIQSANLQALILNSVQTGEVLRGEDPNSRRYQKMLVWHGVGALIHTFALAIFVHLCPLLILPVGMGVYQTMRALHEYSFHGTSHSTYGPQTRVFQSEWWYL